MNEKIAIEIIFFISCGLMMFLLIRKPYLYIRLGVRNIRLETYVLGALLAPLLIILFGLLNYSQIIRGLSGSDSLNPFGILVLFFSMTFMSIYLDIIGFFEFCARLALKFSKNNGTLLFFSFYGIISFLTIFTSNDIIILTFTPFIYYFTKHANVDAVPYLIAEFFAANTWSMMFYIGNPTNIVLSTAFHLDFVDYFSWMFLPTITAGFLNLCLLYLLFKKRIKIPMSKIDEIQPSAAITDKLGAGLGVIILCGCIIALVIAPSYNVDVWMVSLCFALTLLILLLIKDFYGGFLKKHIDLGSFFASKTIKRLPICIIPFILGLFIMIEALRFYNVLTDFGYFLESIIGQSATLRVFVFGFSSLFSANLINNIPMTVAYVPILQAFSNVAHLPAVYATVIGSNLGANITPLGSLAGIMWLSILRNKGIVFSFWEFVKYGLLVTPLTVLSSLCVLSMELAIF